MTKFEAMEQEYKRQQTPAGQAAIDAKREKRIFRKIVKEEFADVRQKVNEVVTAALPADFHATLEAVRATGDGITEYEATALPGTDETMRIFGAIAPNNETRRTAAEFCRISFAILPHKLHNALAKPDFL